MFPLLLARLERLRRAVTARQGPLHPSLERLGPELQVELLERGLAGRLILDRRRVEAGMADIDARIARADALLGRRAGIVHGESRS